MKKIIFLIIISLFLISSCSSKANLSFIKKGISYEKVVSELGEPDNKIDLGVHVFLYNLDDGSKLTLTFIELDSLYSANIVDKDNHMTVLVK